MPPRRRPSRLQTMPERDLFAVIVFCVLIGVIVLQVGHALGNLQARVALAEARIDAIERAHKSP